MVPLSRESIKELAELEGDPVVSWYLDVDGRHRPRWNDVEEAVKRLARRARQEAARRGVQDAVEHDVASIEARLGAGLDRSKMRGLALFSCAGQGLFREIRIGRPVRDQVALNRAPRVGQLEEALEAQVPFVVVLADRQRCRIFRVNSEGAVELAGPCDERARAVDVDRELGGFGHYEDEAVRRHFRRCAATLSDHVEQLPGVRILVGGTDDIAAELERHIEPALRSRLAGHVPLPVTATQREVVVAVAEAGWAVERQVEENLVEALRQRAATGAGGVVGLEPTLEALEQRRVATLLVSRDFRAWGGRCPSCGWTGPDLRLCRRCGTRLEEIDDVVETAIDQAMAQQAGVVVCNNTELDRFGHIGAIERF